jgi:hypothetical protein
VIKTTFKFHGSKITLAGYGFRKYQMVQLGQVAVGAVKTRVAQGVGSDDASMKALADRYKKLKTKAGLTPIRDLTGPGSRTYVDTSKKHHGTIRTIRAESAHMLDNFTVRYADEQTVRMDISAQWARIRARANERRAPWFGFSPNDIRTIMNSARVMFGVNITDLAVKLRAQRGSAVWMNPNGIAGEMLQGDLLRKVA